MDPCGSGLYKSTRGDDRLVTGGRVLSGPRPPLRGNNSPRPPQPAQPLPQGDRRAGGAPPSTRRGPGGAPSAVPSTPGDPRRQRPGDSRRDYAPGPIRPSRLYRRGAGSEGEMPWPVQGGGERNGSEARAPCPEEKEGQTQTLRQSVQRPPRPLREGSRGEEKPRSLSRGALTSPHRCGALRRLDATPR